MGCGFIMAERRGYSRHTQRCMRFKKEVQRLVQPSAAIAPAVSNDNEANMEEEPDFEEPVQPGPSGDVDIEMNEALPVCSTIL